MDFRLPNLGEGIDSATVTAVLVKPGDKVSAGQNVVSVETDKAAVDVPVEAAGTVEEVLVKPGDKVPAGGPLLRLKEGQGSEPTVAPSPPAPPTEKKAETSPPPVAEKQAPAPAGAAKVKFNLPTLGEGIDSATVTAVLVKPGDRVTAGQSVIAVETDKAAVEVPVEADGVVEAIHVKPGDKVPAGQLVLTLTRASGGEEPPVSKSPPPPAAEKPTGRARPKPARERVPSPAPTGNGPAPTTTLIPAGPATRRLARELGVSLTELKGSGRGGRVTLDDIKGFVKLERERVKQGGPAAAPGGSIVNVFGLPPLPDFSKFGEVERRPVANIRQTIARNLTVGWRTMPMVTQNDLADVTELEAGRKRAVDALPKGTPKITMTVLAIKACVAALREFPHVNSSYDMNAGVLVVKKYFHLGIAVDTERGLVVPVIRDADKKNLRDLAAEVTSLAEKARTGKLAIDEMRGGTFTITNLGGIGGTTFTPIVNYPEVAILGMSRSSLQPVVRDGQIVPRLMLPLSLTYDHRVIDGADGARFTSRLVQLFSDPLRLLLET
jgi:pyruvate dehydrogenase E2 component (dihydrolipoamide acetyltransferase)